MKKSIVLTVLTVLMIIVLTVIVKFIGNTKIRKDTDNIKSSLSEQEARAIAQMNCIKGEEALGEGIYNKETKTWWFNANLNMERDGCNPACVVSEETSSAEINWRCTGLAIPPADTVDELTKLFKEKYPQYADTLKVTVKNKTESHVRGSISFAADVGGGIFLAVKANNEWKIVHEGNGQIPCTLSNYDFPAEMLTDCAE